MLTFHPRDPVPAHAPMGWALAVLLTSTSAGAAGDDAVRLEWIREAGAESCPSGAAVVGEVSRRLGRNPFSVDAARSIEVYLRRTRGVWTAHLQARADGGSIIASRDLRGEGAHCSSLADALALLVALTIDPDATAAAPATKAPGQAAAAPLPAAEPPLATAPSPPEPSIAPAFPPKTLDAKRDLPEVTPPSIAPAATPTPSSSRPSPEAPGNAARGAPVPEVRSMWFARSGFSLGLLPHLSPEFAAGARISVQQPFLISAGLVFLPSNRTSNGAFSFGMTAAWLGPCIEAVRLSRGEVTVCVSAFAGQVHAAVKDSALADSGSSPWFAGSASVSGAFRVVGPLTVEIDLNGLTPIGPYRLRAKDCGGVLFQQTTVALLASLGVGVSFR